MQPLNIVLLGTLPLDLTRTRGGVESVCVNLLIGFKDSSEVKIDWITFSRDVSTYTKVLYTDKITLHYIPLLYPRLLLVDFYLNRKALNQIVRDNKPRIIHVQGSAPHLLRLSAFSRKLVVVTQHGIIAEERKFVKGWKQRLKFTFKYLIERYYFPRFQNVIYISAYNRQLSASRSLKHAALIRNPLNELFFANSSLTPEPLRLICVGWISQLKNLRLLLEALVVLRSQGIVLFLTVTGAYKEANYKCEIEEYILETKLGSQLRFTGPLSQPEVYRELQLAEIFVMPSLQENSPVCIAEAMAMGKVVVASDVGAISEMISNGVSGLLFEKGNQQQLVTLLKNLYEDRIDRKQLSENARKSAKTMFCPQQIAVETIAFYRRITRQ